MKYFLLFIFAMTLFAETKDYKLPPEPDPKINNSTLLGIDSNNNGVRDDVERWIYETYDEYIPCTYEDYDHIMPDGSIFEASRKVCEENPIPYHPIVRAVAMQGARAAQIIIQEPEKAKETKKLLNIQAKLDRLDFGPDSTRHIADAGMISTAVAPDGQHAQAVFFSKMNFTERLIKQL